MAERITRKDVERAFTRLAENRGWTVADHSWPITDPRREDAVFLQRTPTGLYRISAYVASSRTGDEPQAFTAEHDFTDAHSGREFVAACRFMARCSDITRIQGLAS